MSKLATTKLSSKGQVVIPEEIRNMMNLNTGDQFLIFAENDVLILKTVAAPDIGEYKEMVKQTRKAVKAAGITKGDVTKAIKDVRKR